MSKQRLFPLITCVYQRSGACTDAILTTLTALSWKYHIKEMTVISEAEIRWSNEPETHYRGLRNYPVILRHKLMLVNKLTRYPEKSAFCFLENQRKLTCYDQEQVFLSQDNETINSQHNSIKKKKASTAVFGFYIIDYRYMQYFSDFFSHQALSSLRKLCGAHFFTSLWQLKLNFSAS